MGETVPDPWKHPQADKVCRALVKEVLAGQPVFRGKMLCCESVKTNTLPRAMVERALHRLQIVDGEVSRRGLSIYCPGGRKGLAKPTLVMGSMSHAGVDPCSLDTSHPTYCGVPGGMPGQILIIISIFSFSNRIAVDMSL